MSGTKASQWEGHMAEIMWRSVVKANVFPEFFRLLTTVYTLQAPPNLTYPTPLFDSWEGFGAVSQQDIVHPVVSDAGSTDSEVLQLEAASQVLGSNSESDQDDIHISHVPHPPANVGNPETERQPIKRKTVKKMELITELLHDSSLSSEGEVTIIAPRFVRKELRMSMSAVRKDTSQPMRRARRNVRKR